VLFCENNGYAEFSRASSQHAATLEQRAAGYGIDHVAVDGNDVVATARAMGEVVAAVRSDRGPVLVEAATYRWHGHYEGDPERYRTAEEVAAWEARDPLVVHERRLRAAGVGDDEIKALEISVADELDDAVDEARRMESPDPASLHDFVVRPRPVRDEPKAPSARPSASGRSHRSRWASVPKSRRGSDPMVT
jgi:2-oxoisovalerate dehydrogenase E1 component